MNESFVRFLQVPSLILAGALQVLPLARSALPFTQTATNLMAIIFRWTAGAAAALGAMDAVSGASTKITSSMSLKATNGVAFSQRLTTAPDQAGYWSATGLPTGLALTGTAGKSLWRIEGTPTTSGTFSVQVTAKEKSDSKGDRVISGIIVLTVIATGSPPAIAQQPSSQTVSTGYSASFSITASGTAPLSYQWLFNGVNLSGQTTSALTLDNVAATQAGTYSVVVKNGLGSVTSAAARLTVLQPPLIMDQPVDQTVMAGESATFRLAAAGSEPLTYQWMFDGAALDGEIRSELILSSVKAAQAGRYEVLVSNSAGNVLSHAGTLSVRVPLPAQAPIFNQVAIREGKIVAMFVGEIGATYLVERSTDLISWQVHQTIGPVTVAEPISVELVADTDALGFLRIRLAP